MNALVKKELHLLLPGFAGILALETLVPWIFRDADYVFSYTPVAFFLGLTLLTVDAFGREFNLGTFPWLMAQPVDREKIWRTKLTLLLAAAALISCAHVASCGLRLHNVIQAPAPVSPIHLGVIESDFHRAMLASAALLLAAITGGLWCSLWLRQTAAAFWMAFTCPLAVLLLAALMVPAGFSAQHFAELLLGLALLYSLAGLWLAHRLFYRAQDVSWSGPVIHLGRWRYYESARQTGAARRDRRPMIALLKKELQLQGVSLFCVASLLAAHLVVFAIRALYGNFHRDSLVSLVANGFWTFWLIVPAVIGCTAVAEERKLGALDGQFCLPVSRRSQFAVKLVLAILAGTFFGGVLPLLLETTAGRIGLPNEFFESDNHLAVTFLGITILNAYQEFLVCILATPLALVWFGVLASTLTKSFLHALSLTVTGVVLLLGLAAWAAHSFVWKTPTPFFVGAVVAPVTLTWLAWRNFNRFQEGWLLWRRNVLGIAIATAVVAGVSAVVYYRAWEVFEPLEPRHGAAKFTLANPPRIAPTLSGDLLVRWPDGRASCCNIDLYYTWGSRYWRYVLSALLAPGPEINGPCHSLSGSNWVSVSEERTWLWSDPRGWTNGYCDIVGIRGDGTLWIAPASRSWPGGEMQPVGQETNWLQVARCYNNFLLLKNNGTLWWWGWGTNILDWDQRRFSLPSVRNRPILQVGTNTDWTELGQQNSIMCLARRRDGSTFLVNWEYMKEMPLVARQPYLDQVALRSFWDTSLGVSGGWEAYVSHDGTLRARVKRGSPGDPEGSEFMPLGSGTNWLKVTLCRDWLVALKSDGTLWKWNLVRSGDRSALFTEKPARVGNHSDWLGLCECNQAIVALAADGSLWSWPGTDEYDFALMRPPKQPHRLGNIVRDNRPDSL